MEGNRREISRRSFLRAALVLGGLSGTITFLDGCLKGEEKTMSSQATPNSTSVSGQKVEVSPMPQKTPTVLQGGKARVVLVRTSDRVSGTRKAIELFGVNPVEGKKVVLKPNFNSADVAPGSTHNDTLRTLVLKLREMGATDITLAERSGPPDTRMVMEEKGIFKLAQELGFKVINLHDLSREDWVEIQPPGSHWENGFLFPKIYKEAERIVTTCCLKTHAYGGHFTLSLKLAVGLTPREGYSYMREMHSSPNHRLMIAELNYPYKPDLIVLDGVDAFTEGGPATGKRVQANVILAGNDRIAVDAVGVAILRHFGTTPEVSNGPIFKQQQIARAVELGLGIDSPDKIEIVTGDEASENFAGNIRKILAV